MESKAGKFRKKVNYCFQIVGVGAVTGLFAGLVVTLYNVLVNYCEDFSADYYSFFRDNPAFIPLLFCALFLGGIVIGGVVKFLPMIRGSGFPQTEGATRGLMRFKWYEILPGMFAASLFTIFMGLSAGCEGPSLMLGGACGNGVGSVLRRNIFVRRYQITGGACAGLAVALNAPLTGMVFAYEEAHRRFTPEVFVCSFSSVVFAIVVRNLLLTAMGIAVEPVLSSFSFAENTGLMFCLYVLLASVVVALAGVAFYHLVFVFRRLFKKITFWHGVGKMTVPFVFAGAAGLLTVYAMGGGLHFIRALGSGAAGLETLFSSPVFVTLLVVIVVKFVATLVNLGADVPCCASFPMLAIGGGIGALMGIACEAMGMDPALCDALVAVCMVTFFATVVKAPITGIVMLVELTWNFTFLLPAIIGVAVGYLAGMLFHTEPLYDKLLDEMLEERAHDVRRITVKLRVGERLDGSAVRDILWPFTAVVTGIKRGDATIVPKGATEMYAGDVITVEGSPDDRDEYVTSLVTLVGDLVEEQYEILPEEKE